MPLLLHRAAIIIHCYSRLAKNYRPLYSGTGTVLYLPPILSIFYHSSVSQRIQRNYCATVTCLWPTSSQLVERFRAKIQPIGRQAKAKFHYAILVADRSEACRRNAASWNLAYHPSSLAAS